MYTAEYDGINSFLVGAARMLLKEIQEDINVGNFLNL